MDGRSRGFYSMLYAPAAIRMTGTMKSRQVSRNCFPKILSRVWASGIQERMKEPAVENGEVQVMSSPIVLSLIHISFRIENLTGINDNMVLPAPTIDRVLPDFLSFCRGAVMVAHNAGFDMSFIEKNCEDLGIQQEFTVADTVAMARYLLPGLNRFKLDTVAKAVGCLLYTSRCV